MIICLILSVFLISFTNSVQGNFAFPAIFPEHCNSTEYYDSICVRCKRCGKNESQVSLQVRSPEGYCTCISHFYMKNRKNSYDIVCSPCPTSTVPSKDKSICLKCGDNNPFNETTGNCEPCATGVPVETCESITCMSCDSQSTINTYILDPANIFSKFKTPSPEFCSQSNMIYSGNHCLTSLRNEASLFSIKYEIGVNIQSAYLKENFNSALQFCKEGEDFACQALANMCVLLLYRLSVEDNACSEFRKIAKKRLDECSRKHLWLYYFDDGEAKWNATKNLYQDNVPNVFTPLITEKASRLHIIAKQYALNGSFLGISKIRSDDLCLCQESDTDEDIPFIVGSQIQRSCTRSLQSLWLSSQLIFNDLYLVDENNTNVWYPIPILIKGVIVNEDFVNLDKEQSKWLLVRRFFLTDHISSEESGMNLQNQHNQPIAKVFRYAADVSLKVSFNPHDTPGKIYPPLLIIKYAEASSEDFLKNKKVTVSFSVSYEMDQSTVKKNFVIILSVFGVLSFAWSVLQTFSWFRRSGKSAVDLVSLGKFSVILFGNLSATFFAVTFIFCLYWFSFYKKQNVLYTILPTPEQEYFIKLYLGIAFAMKVLHLIHLMFVQCSINIFFIDWERPRVRASSVSARSATTSKSIAETSVSVESKKLSGNIAKNVPDKINSEMAGISIWRTYYVANEWAEIQSLRKINLSAQLFGVLFILKVLDFESSALASLSLNVPSTDVNKYVPYSSCSRFALGASVYLAFALLQVIFRKGIYERFIEDKLQQYVDLCSVSNVSVFLLLTKRFGYYIHGRSTHGKSDVNMKEMHEFLRKEEEDLCGHRGLLPDTPQQTFQFILPSGVHDQFLRLLCPLTSYSQAADRMQGVGGRLAKVDIDRVTTTHYMLNKFLSGFIDHSFKDLDYIVKDKVMLEYLFDIECFEVADRGYFYNDDGRSFSNVIFYGNELTLLLFDVLLFSVLDLASSDYVLSAILTFITAKCLQGLRRSAGRRNLVRKALIDERFLT